MSVITKATAEKALQDLTKLLENNPNFLLVSPAYCRYMEKAVESLARRIKRGDFDLKKVAK